MEMVQSLRFISLETTHTTSIKFSQQFFSINTLWGQKNIWVIFFGQTRWLSVFKALSFKETRWFRTDGLLFLLGHRIDINKNFTAKFYFENTFDWHVRLTAKQRSTVDGPSAIKLLITNKVINSIITMQVQNSS